VRERHELADGERLGHRHEAEQAVLEPGALGRRRRASQRAEPGVDLERVGGDRDGVLAARAQQVGERERDGGLADARRAEDRDDGQRAAPAGHRAAQPSRARSCSSPASVVLVAAAISTWTSSPGCATPVKLTEIGRAHV
jgi:hypothetical protein